MNNSRYWVSHTPSSTSKDDELELQEDFATTEGTYQRSPSPPTAFEKFFLPIEETGGDTSTFALAASRINNTPTSRRLHSSRSSIASESILTEDFASATDDLSATSDLDDISLEDYGQKSTIFNDVLGRQAILEETPEEHEIDMGKRSKKTKMATTKEPITATKPPPPLPEPTPATTATTPEEEKADKPAFDVIDHVYEGAKSAWMFGKGIIIFKPFMGVAEGAATKMISITTGISSLEDADKQIKSTLSGVDKEFIDPAILKLWSVIEPIIGKSDEVLKAVLGAVSKKVPMLEGEKKPETPAAMKKESDEALAPETSTPAVIS